MREAAAFVEPALLPNVVDRVPGWRRHLPAAFLLLAVAAFLVGFARPHAKVSVPLRGGDRDHRDRHVALDGRDRRPADPARRCPGLRAPVPRATCPEQVPRLGRRVQHARAGRRRADERPRYVDGGDPGLRVGEATALGDALATAVDVARGTPEGVKPPAGEKPVPAVVLVLSDGAVDGGRVELPEAIRRARDAKVPVFTALLGTEAGVVAGAARRRLRRADPGAAGSRRAPPRRRADRRQLLRCADRGGSRHRLRRPEVAPRRTRTRTRRSPSPSRPPARPAAARRRASRHSGSGGSREGRGRRDRAGAALARWRPGRAGRGRMQGADGLHPGRRAVGRDPRRRRRAFRERDWRLVCPEGVVGGVDARASEPAVAVEFPGRIGSPVNPGHHDHAVARVQGHLCRPGPPCHDLPAVHRLHSRRRRRAAHADRVHAVGAVKPGEPITVRVATLSVQPGQLARTTLSCRPGERLLRSAPQRRSLHARRADEEAARRRPRRARHAWWAGTRERDARAGLPADVRAAVQVQAECAK